MASFIPGNLSSLPLAWDIPVHEPELDPPFEIIDPSRLTSPLVLSSPHSGSVYPAEFLASSRLDAATLRRSEDAYVDELFMGGVRSAAPLIRARFPRAYLDLNREPYELDPRMFETRLPSFANTRSVRVAGGLGTVARVVGDSQEISLISCASTKCSPGSRRFISRIIARSRLCCRAPGRHSGWRS